MANSAITSMLFQNQKRMGRTISRMLPNLVVRLPVCLLRFDGQEREEVAQAILQLPVVCHPPVMPGGEESSNKFTQCSDLLGSAILILPPFCIEQPCTQTNCATALDKLTNTAVDGLCKQLPECTKQSRRSCSNKWEAVVNACHSASKNRASHGPCSFKHAHAHHHCGTIQRVCQVGCPTCQRTATDGHSQIGNHQTCYTH
mmetsp:Transcript_107088/g.207529  ORF Transcript_107088/g.207529 Transcript_107088/m.207529 type:complete len:201 (-) Transcript_107088:428-1030(-)